MISEVACGLCCLENNTPRCWLKKDSSLYHADTAEGMSESLNDSKMYGNIVVNLAVLAGNQGGVYFISDVSQMGSLSSKCLINPKGYMTASMRVTKAASHWPARIS